MAPDFQPVLSDDLVRAAAAAAPITRHNGHIDILREMADGVTGR
jgi:hypothetical protein